MGAPSTEGAPIYRRTDYSYHTNAATLINPYYSALNKLTASMRALK